MSVLTQRALALWSTPVPPGIAGLEAFQTLYTDPVTVNGDSVALTSLVERARMMQTALADMQHTVLEEFGAPGRVAFAFRITGRHVGSFASAVGNIPPSGATITFPGMDIFGLDDDGRVSQIWAVADVLDLLAQAGSVGVSGTST